MCGWMDSTIAWAWDGSSRCRLKLVIQLLVHPTSQLHSATSQQHRQTAHHWIIMLICCAGDWCDRPDQVIDGTCVCLMCQQETRIVTAAAVINSCGVSAMMGNTHKSKWGHNGHQCVDLSSMHSFVWSSMAPTRTTAAATTTTDANDGGTNQSTNQQIHTTSKSHDRRKRGGGGRSNEQQLQKAKACCCCCCKRQLLCCWKQKESCPKCTHWRWQW